MRAEMNKISYGGAKGCVDIDVYSTVNADCEVYQVCYNTAGSYPRHPRHVTQRHVELVSTVMLSIHTKDTPVLIKINAQI